MDDTQDPAPVAESQLSIEETPDTAAKIVSSIQLTAHLHVTEPKPDDGPIALPTVAEVAEVCRVALDKAYGTTGRAWFTISGAQHV